MLKVNLKISKKLNEKDTIFIKSLEKTINVLELENNKIVFFKINIVKEKINNNTITILEESEQLNNYIEIYKKDTKKELLENIYKIYQNKMEYKIYQIDYDIKDGLEKKYICELQKIYKSKEMTKKNKIKLKREYEKVDNKVEVDKEKNLKIYYCPYCKETKVKKENIYNLVDELDILSNNIIKCDNCKKENILTNIGTEKVYYAKEKENHYILKEYNYKNVIVQRENNQTLIKKKIKAKSIIMFKNSYQQHFMFKEYKDILNKENMYDGNSNIHTMLIDINKEKLLIYFLYRNNLLDKYNEYLNINKINHNVVFKQLIINMAYYQYLNGKGIELEKKEFFDYNFKYTNKLNKKIEILNTNYIDFSNYIDLMIGKKSTRKMRKNIKEFVDNGLEITILYEKFENTNYVNEIIKNNKLEFKGDYLKEFELKKYFDLIFGLFKEEKIYNYYKKREIREDDTFHYIDYDNYYIDINYMYKKIVSIIGRVKLKKMLSLEKFSIIGFHDNLTKIHNDIKERKIYIKYDKKTKIYFKKKYDKVEFELPKSNKELKEWGIEMSNCVGSYFNRIIQKELLVVGLFKNKELKYVIEIDKNGVINQNKSKYNNYMCENKEDYNYIYKYMKDLKLIYKEYVKIKNIQEKITKLNLDIKRKSVKYF